MSATIVDALAALCPGAVWELTGTDYSGLTWLDKTQAKPTEAAITEEMAVLTAASAVPQSVTACQARLALNAGGLLAEVNTAVNAAGGATLITWEYATIINRADPLITSIGTSLGLTSAAIDALFVAAAALTP